MKAWNKRKDHKKEKPTEEKLSLRNRGLHIPLDFEQAVEGLLNTKPKKQQHKK